MIVIKNKKAITKMKEAGKRLAEIFVLLQNQIFSGVSTQQLNDFVEKQLFIYKMTSKMKGYQGYKHVSCIAINDEVVHGVPKKDVFLSDGDLVTIDVCASWGGYCADMARNFFVGNQATKEARVLVDVAQASLNEGIKKIKKGNFLGDVSHAIQKKVEKHGFGVVRDFAGHGIGKLMHEEPEVLNYGNKGEGPMLQVGMAFAIEPMITQGHYSVYVESDGWTVKTKDKSLAAHVEDTVIITDNGPYITTR